MSNENEKNPSPLIRDLPRAGFLSILAIGDASTGNPGLCVDSSGDLVLVRHEPITSVWGFEVSVATRKTHKELYVRGLPVPQEASAQEVDARRLRIAAEEMRRADVARRARIERDTGRGERDTGRDPSHRTLPERPLHDPHERPDAPPEACGA